MNDIDGVVVLGFQPSVVAFSDSFIDLHPLLLDKKYVLLSKRKRRDRERLKGKQGKWVFSFQITNVREEGRRHKNIGRFFLFYVLSFFS